jgi:hypothetical protein
MFTRLLLLAAMLCLAACAFAQPDPNAPNGGNPLPQRLGNVPMGQNSPFALEITPTGVFAIHNGVVAKYTAGLGEAAGVKELFPALPEQPKLSENPTPEERQALAKWIGIVGERTAPFGVLAKDGMLYLVIGTKFFRVNQQTLAVEANADLTPPANAARALLGRGDAPVLKLDGNVLYVLAGQEFLALAPQTGAVQSRMLLPPAMFPEVLLGNLRGLLNPNAGGGRGPNNAPGGPGGMRTPGGAAGDRGPGGQGGERTAPPPPPPANDRNGAQVDSPFTGR